MLLLEGISQVTKKGIKTEELLFIRKVILFGFLENCYDRNLQNLLFCSSRNKIMLFKILPCLFHTTIEISILALGHP